MATIHNMGATYDTVAGRDILTEDILSIAEPILFEKNSEVAPYDSRGFSKGNDSQMLVSFQAREGATYFIVTQGSSNPTFIEILDNLGDSIALYSGNTSDDINNTFDATTHSRGLKFVAPYTGLYYAGSLLTSKVEDGSGVMVIAEDIDTAVNPNHLPTGEIKISGNPKQDESLTVTSSLADEDGLGDFEYQWLSDNKEITDETLETYKISASDMGKTISVKVSYVDGEGTLETVASSPTAVVTAKGATKGNDSLFGTKNNDTIVGGLGKDTLTGDSGADVFKFNSSNETGTTTKTRDVITDFKHSEGDKIDLSGIDANSKLAGDQAFKFIGSKSFSGAAGELRLDSTNHILYGNVNSDKVPDFAIQLNGVSSLVVGDFVL